MYVCGSSGSKTMRLMVGLCWRLRNLARFVVCVKRTCSPSYRNHIGLTWTVSSGRTVPRAANRGRSSSGARSPGMSVSGMPGGYGSRHDDRGAAEAPGPQVRQRLVDELQRVRAHAGLHRDLRGEAQELLAVAPREVRDGAQHPLLPQLGIGERRDVAHVDA